MLSSPQWAFCKLAFMADKEDEERARAGYAARLLEAFRFAGKVQASGDPDRAWLAGAIGVSVQAVGGALGKLTKKPVQPFSTYYNAKAARALGVNPVWLATGEEEMRARSLPPLAAPQSPEEMGGFVGHLVTLFTHLDADSRDELIAFANDLAAGPNRRWTRADVPVERRSYGGFGGDSDRSYRREFGGGHVRSAPKKKRGDSQ